MASSSPLPPRAEHAIDRRLVWGGAGLLSCALLAFTTWLSHASQPGLIAAPLPDRQLTCTTDTPPAPVFVPRIEVTQLGTSVAPASQRAPIRVIKAASVLRKKKERAAKRHKAALSKRGKRAKKRSRNAARHS